MADYLLKHKDTVCALLSINDNGKLLQVRIVDPASAPFMGHADEKLMELWWSMRTVPASRTIMQEVIRRAGCQTPEEYLAKNLAVSVAICPIGSGLHWDDVNIRHMRSYNEGHIPYHNATSYDPNASLGGQMDKYWDLNGEKPVLVKQAYEHYGQQAINEAFATWIHKLQGKDIPYVAYTTEPIENGALCRCDAFTSDEVEFVSAYEVMSGVKQPGDMSSYEQYISICANNGIPEEELRRFLDYQTLTDFIISNTDEHLMNFGVLRDTSTLRLLHPAPIFDSGNSMFFRDTTYIPKTRYELLQIPITAFHEQEERMLKHIRDRHVVDLDRLPSPDEVRAFYLAARIPEEKASCIAADYAGKLELARDFQQGKSISAYEEDRRTQHEAFLPHL